MLRGPDSLHDDYQQFLSSMALLERDKHYYHVVRPVLLPEPFHCVYVPALYFDHGIYCWIFCATVAHTQALAPDLSRSGLQEDDSNVANLNIKISKQKQAQNQKQEEADIAKSQVILLKRNASFSLSNIHFTLANTIFTCI